MKTPLRASLGIFNKSSAFISIILKETVFISTNSSLEGGVRRVLIETLLEFKTKATTFNGGGLLNLKRPVKEFTSITLARGFL